MNNIKPINNYLGMYLHIPFCMDEKCFYCDFHSVKTNSFQVQLFLKAIQSEIQVINEIFSNSKFSTLYIGGGTPTVLNEKSLSSLIKLLYKNFKFKDKAEVTIEVNPGSLTKQKVKLLKTLGINRLSIGVQSFADELLEQMGRKHRTQQIMETFSQAREDGFDNINLDLIFGYPGQTKQQWLNTLEKVMQLSPEHISCYSLSIERGTVLYRNCSKGIIEKVDEEDELEMYLTAIKKLKSKYLHYEISNFSKDNKQCQHNVNYWKNGNYLGLGAVAASHFNGFRHNNKTLPDYFNNDFKSKLNFLIKSIKRKNVFNLLKEAMFLNLRLIDGINKQEFLHRFGKLPQEVFPNELNCLKQKNLLQEDKNYIKLTSKAIPVANVAFMEFV